MAYAARTQVWLDCTVTFVIAGDRYVLGPAKCQIIKEAPGLIADVNVMIDRTLASEKIRTAGVGDIVVELEDGRRSIALGTLNVANVGDTVSLLFNN